MRSKWITDAPAFVCAALLAGAAFAFVMPMPAHAQQCIDANTRQNEDGTTTADPSCAVAFASVASTTASTTLSQQGIFGCLGQGAAVANVGTTRAIGGVFVPVNDAAVTLNTGFLVYKECILDGMARNIAQNVSAEYTRQQIEAFNTGRQGGAQYLQNWQTFISPYLVQSATVHVQGLQTRCGAFCGTVPTAVARTSALGLGVISGSRNAPSPGAVSGITSGSSFDWNTFTRMTSGYYELAEYDSAITDLEARNRALASNMRDLLLMSRGVIPTFDSNPDPLALNVVTPGFVIADSISQAIGSGYRQLELANEIDQVVSNLFGGLTTRLLSSGSGIPGLFATTGTQPAYLDRMVAQTQSAVRAGAVNAALNILAAARQTEAAYLEAKQGIATAIINAIAQLRSYESQCWNLIIPAVQAHAQQNGNPTLTIATSTQFSDAVIDDPANNIRQLGTTTAAEITVSEQTMAMLDQLIVAVTNTSSSAAQQQALIQLDQMVANNQLHSTQDAQAAADQRGTIQSALSTLLDNTRTTWADSQDANVGWCNINNPAVIERWFNEWR